MIYKLCITLWLLIQASVFAVEEIQGSVTEIVVIENVECNDSWKIGVQQHCAACALSLIQFYGPTHNIAETLYKSLTTFVTELENLTEDDSETLSSQSVSILEAVSLLAKVGTSPSIIASEFSKVLEPVADAYRNIVLSLSVLGQQTEPINDAITNVEFSLKQILADFQSGDCGESDYEPVTKSVQALTNTISNVAQTLLGACESNTVDVHESVTVLTLTLTHFLIMSHGTTTSIAAVLYASTQKIPPSLSVCLKSVDSLLGDFIDSINSIENALTENIEELITSLANLTAALNATLESVIGLVFDVDNLLADIL